MQEASEAVPSGMLSVLGQRQSNFTFACMEAQEHCKSLGIENPVCQVSNYLFPDCRVISGHLEVSVDGSHAHRLQTMWSRESVRSQWEGVCLAEHGLEKMAESRGCVWQSECFRGEQKPGYHLLPSRRNF